MQIEQLLIKLVTPAQRAIQTTGVNTLEQLAKYSEEEVMALDGIGKNAMVIIKEMMRAQGLTFANKK